MKWAIIGLCCLGSVAAASAGLLVHAMRMQTAGAKPGITEVNVLFARKTLSAMSVVQSSDVELRKVAPDKAPPQSMSSMAAVLGKILTKPLHEGEAFSPSCLADAGSVQQLAAVIPSGKRAVGISVTNYAGLDGLLYPGSMVDVMVSLKSGEGSESTRRDAFTTVLLENVQVLAIEKRSVVSPAQAAPVESTRGGDSQCVTLMVDTKQAKALQLAMEQGTLSLALRNPLDAESTDKDAVYAQSLTGGPLRERAAATPTTAPSGPRWEVEILRAGVVELKSFPIADKQPAAN